MVTRLTLSSITSLISKDERQRESEEAKIAAALLFALSLSY